MYPWHTPSHSFSYKSHNSALVVTGSDEDALIIEPTMVEQYDTHVGNDLNVNLPKTLNMILRHAHCTSSTNGSLLVSDSCATCFIMKGLGVSIKIEKLTSNKGFVDEYFSTLNRVLVFCEVPF